MKIQAAAIVKKLFLQGIMVTVNHEIDYEKAEEIALEFNCIAEPEVKVDVIEELLKEEEEDTSGWFQDPRLFASWVMSTTVRHRFWMQYETHSNCQRGRRNHTAHRRLCGGN